MLLVYENFWSTPWFSLLSSISKPALAFPNWIIPPWPKQYQNICKLKKEKRKKKKKNANYTSKFGSVQLKRHRLNEPIPSLTTNPATSPLPCNPDHMLGSATQTVTQSVEGSRSAPGSLSLSLFSLVNEQFFGWIKIDENGTGLWS